MYNRRIDKVEHCWIAPTLNKSQRHVLCQGVWSACDPHLFQSCSLYRGRGKVMIYHDCKFGVAFKCSASPTIMTHHRTCKYGLRGISLLTYCADILGTRRKAIQAICAQPFLVHEGNKHCIQLQCITGVSQMHPFISPSWLNLLSTGNCL